MYASLTDSYEWNQLNTGNALATKIANTIKNGQVVSPADIPTAMLTLKNRLKSPIMSKMLDAMEHGNLVLIYNPKERFPVYLPFVLMRTNPHTCTGYVILNNLDASQSEPNGEIFLNARKLKVSMESCYVAMKIADIGDAPKLKSTAILRSGSKIYSNIVCECINRRHGIRLDPVVHNSLLYLTSRYYVGTIIGCRGKMEPDVMRNYCFYNCKNVEFVDIVRIIDQFTDNDFDNIGTFIHKITNVEEFKKRLGSLTTANFLESYINMYDASMLLALENFNYFFYNVLAVIESTYTNNYQTLKNIVGDDGKKLYADLITTALSV